MRIPTGRYSFIHQCGNFILGVAGCVTMNLGQESVEVGVQTSSFRYRERTRLAHGFGRLLRQPDGGLFPDACQPCSIR